MQVCRPHSETEGGFVNNWYKWFSTSKVKCQYHRIFAPEYHRKEIYGQSKAGIGKILQKLREQKSAEMFEAEAYSAYIHMFVSIPTNLSVG